MVSYEHMSLIATCKGDRVFWLDYRLPGQFTRPSPVTESSAHGDLYRGNPPRTPCLQTINSTTKNSNMKARKSRNLVIMFLVVAGVFAGHVFNATALTWTGLSTVTNLWSDTNNWLPTQPLTFDYTAAFGNAGSTNVIGAVNNVVGTDYTLTNLVYSAVFNGPTGAFNFDTTLINDGVTLTVKAPNTTFCLVGNATNQGAAASNYTAIVGMGRLVLGDPASPGAYTNGFLQVKQAGASGLHRAILDMSRLDNFTFAAGKFLVAANGTFGGNGDIPLGTVLLANTNVITC